jgi:hypothetical protein
MFATIAFNSFAIAKNARSAKITLLIQFAGTPAFQFSIFGSLGNFLSYFLYLPELQLHRCRAAENCDHHF